MSQDVLTVAEYDGGIKILSVVRPLGDTDAEHVFQVVHGATILGEAATMTEAAALAAKARAESQPTPNR
jgi:hypothetical protein